MRFLFACALLLLGLREVSLRAEPLRLFVATNGNDGWSGKLERPSRDAGDGPKATLVGALTTARTTDRSAREDGTTILLRDGVCSAQARTICRRPRVVSLLRYARRLPTRY